MINVFDLDFGWLLSHCWKIPLTLFWAWCVHRSSKRLHHLSKQGGMAAGVVSFILLVLMWNNYPSSIITFLYLDFCLSPVSANRRLSKVAALWASLAHCNHSWVDRVFHQGALALSSWQFNDFSIALTASTPPFFKTVTFELIICPRYGCHAVMQ